MDTTIELSSSLEDYLEAIKLLQERKRAVRVKDVSQHLGVKASSVNGAVQILSQKGLIEHEHYGYIELTPSGEQVAQDIQLRHRTLLAFLTDVLKIPHYIAAEEACAMEHHIGSQTLERLVKFIAFASPASQGGTAGWLRRFHQTLISEEQQGSTPQQEEI